jgi:hypothetical protein
MTPVLLLDVRRGFACLGGKPKFIEKEFEIALVAEFARNASNSCEFGYGHAGFVPWGISRNRTTSHAKPTFSISQMQ